MWFDALINYVSALEHKGADFFDAYWPCCNHLIAKDILKPHAVFWPTMLMAAGLPLYHRLNVHGYWIMDRGKMSKSLGNVIRPLDMKERYGMDAFRYYLLREMVFGQDATFSMEAFVNRVNADLANNFGNLVSRVLAMQKRYFGGLVQPMGDGARTEDRELKEAFMAAAENVDRHMEEMAFHRALESIFAALDKTNQYIVQTAPFTLVKDPDQKPRVGEILHTLLESVRITGELLGPFLPETAAAIRNLLGLPAGDALRTEWGGSFPEGHQVQPPKILFPRIEETESDGK